MPRNQPYQPITVADGHGSSGDVRDVPHVGAVGPQGLSLPQALRSAPGASGVPSIAPRVLVPLHHGLGGQQAAVGPQAEVEVPAEGADVEVELAGAVRCLARPAPLAAGRQHVGHVAAIGRRADGNHQAVRAASAPTQLCQETHHTPQQSKDRSLE